MTDFMGKKATQTIFADRNTIKIFKLVKIKNT